VKVKVSGDRLAQIVRKYLRIDAKHSAPRGACVKLVDDRRRCVRLDLRKAARYAPTVANRSRSRYRNFESLAITETEIFFSL
jgi:hypothetical protein